MYACPKCSSKNLSVEVTAVARLIQVEGVGIMEEVASDLSWDGDSRMVCDACEHEDIAKRFYDEASQS